MLLLLLTWLQRGAKRGGATGSAGAIALKLLVAWQYGQTRWWVTKPSDGPSVW